MTQVVQWAAERELGVDAIDDQHRE